MVKVMKVLVACEESQEVCKAFRALGHEAYSCDILPCSGGHPEWHIQWDVLEVIDLSEGGHFVTEAETPIWIDKWDLMIAHPPCTYLCNSGVCWLYNKDGSRNIEREKLLCEASAFFCTLLRAPIPLIVVENPIPHKYAMLPKYSQIIQPWMFGHGETKATCLWLKGLPILKPSNIVSGRVQRLHRLPPSKDRAMLRSKTYPGIAQAMAEQWGGV